MRSLPMLAVLALLMAVPAPGHAQPVDAAKERERRIMEQLRRAQAAQQQATRERDELLAAQGGLESKLKEAMAASGRSAAQAGALRKDLERANAQLAEQQAAAAQFKVEIAALAARSREQEAALEARLRRLEQEGEERERRITLREAQLRQLQSTAEERATGLAACTVRADQLYNAGRDLLDRLQRRSAAESEPVLQWTRISGFEEAQRWRDRLDELKAGGAPAGAGR